MKRGYEIELVVLAELAAQPFAGKMIGDVRPSDFAGYRDALTERRVAPSTIKRRFTVLSAVIEYAISEMDMPALANGTRLVKLAKVEDERDRLFVGSEESDYFEHAPRYGRGVFVDVARFAIETTMRKGEMVGIDEVDGKGVKQRRHDGILWGMVCLDKKIIKLPGAVAKTGKARDVPLSPLAMELIEKQVPAKGKLDPLSKVFDISPDGVRNAHRRTCAAAGIHDFHFHDLRHVGTTRWARVLPLLQLMRVTGHKDPRMLARYYNQEATEVADLMAAV